MNRKWKWLLGISFALAFIVVSGVVFVSSHNKSSMDIIVALSEHILQVKLLREDPRFYYFKVEKTLKGNSDFIGREIKQKKIFVFDKTVKAKNYIFVRSFTSDNEAELTFPEKYYYRVSKGLRKLLFHNISPSELEESLNKQREYFYRKPILSDIKWHDAFFRKHDQAREILLVKVLEERVKIKDRIFKVKVAVEKVLKGEKNLLGRNVFLTYYVRDYLEGAGYSSSALTIDESGENDSISANSSTSPQEREVFDCNLLEILEKNHRYIIQVGQDSAWEDSENLKLEKKFPQFSSLIECEVVEDSSPYFKLVLNSF